VTEFCVRKKRPDDVVVALVGNPNVGKSTVFNHLTGLKQHTGNWPGKTVELAQGRYEYKGRGYVLVDLPGTYSLCSHSREEQVTEEFLSSGLADVTLVVCDATCLERNLHLALQTVQRCCNTVLCVNLLDEAKRARIAVDLGALSRQLGVPVVGISAAKDKGLDALRETLRRSLASPPVKTAACAAEGSGDFSAEIAMEQAERIVKACVSGQGRPLWQMRLDRILTGRITGTAVMLLLLMGVFWLTIRGANYPSELLESFFARLGLWMRRALSFLPPYILLPLMDGVYATTAKVVSVMLPPMAIFFPIFTLLEDFGYLPRVAFLLDHRFETCGSCGKQALSMCMGFGCNAAGVVGCRIIDSPRERIIGMVTNSLVPCNGRFPILIALVGAFFAGNGLKSAAMLTALVLLSILMTFAASCFLSKTFLRGQLSAFAMELPPFRKPQIIRVIVRSVLDRTAHILARAAAVAAPAGLVIWLVTNIELAGLPILHHLANLLHPVGVFLGMNGVILAAFLLAFPANELVLPMILLALSAQNSALPLGDVLQSCGWTAKTALCTMLFCLFHWPCSTTVLTVWKETKSFRWTALAVLLPTFIGALLCALCNVII